MSPTTVPVALAQIGWAGSRPATLDRLAATVHAAAGVPTPGCPGPRPGNHPYVAGRWTWQAFLERRRRRIERWRGKTWPVVVGLLVAVVVDEILDDADGDKSLTAWVVSAALGLAAYAVCEWVRRDPG